SSGSGTYDRVYQYLDGGDQVQNFAYRCTLANAGTEAITVVNQQHTTRHVIESCTGKPGDFVNEYWFENGNYLRQSKQLLVQGWEAVTFKRVIDNG
ncbi:MAG: YjbF family lipoprotein, partial [Paracoccaceae bacterium]